MFVESEVVIKHNAQILEYSGKLDRSPVESDRKVPSRFLISSDVDDR